MRMGWSYQGNGTAADLFEDRLVFRNLRPLDSRLPGLADLRGLAALPDAVTPRKLDPEYGTIVAGILAAAQDLRDPAIPLQELVYIGDTQGSDGNAFRHIREAGGWRGALLIVDERAGDPELDAGGTERSITSSGNHWATTALFGDCCQENGFQLGEGTAAVIDLDKTTLGGRGRNDQIINQARVAAVQQAVHRALEGEFELARFQRNYQVLNDQEHHWFTGDNQDNIAYLCILVGSGLVELESLLADLDSRRLGSFGDFLDLAEQRVNRMSPALRAFHQEFRELVLGGDPTPFKAFRRREYLETISRMRGREEGLPAAEFLERNIALTGEVYQLALAWKRRGVLLFGLSDKPDEASLPTAEQESEGWLPVHQVQTAVIAAD